ncbi:hypothetical protein BAE46_00765 [Glaciecola punicea]|nr:hypothetical protein BAE46_00765 [Glaciecola punicea]
MEIVFYIILALTIISLLTFPMYSTPIVFILVFLGSKFLDDEKKYSLKQHIFRAIKFTFFASIFIWIIYFMITGSGHRFGG